MARPVSVQPTTSPTSRTRVRREETEALRRENEALRQALKARRLLERAKTVLITRDGLTEPDAHRCIQQLSMDSRMPMIEVARGLVFATQTRRDQVGARSRPSIARRAMTCRLNLGRSSRSSGRQPLASRRGPSRRKDLA
jgi:ANTAR domain